MIKIWTATKKIALLDRVFGTVLKKQKPNIPEHSFEEYQPSWTPTPPPGGVLLVCGKKPLSHLAASGVVPKNRTEASLREKPIQHSNGGWYLVTYDPYSIMSDGAREALIQWDVMLATRLVKNGHIKPVVGEYKWVGSYAPMIERIKAKYEETGQPVDVASDLETMGLSSFVPGKQIVSISFTLENGTAELLYTGPNYDDPVPIEDPTKIREQIVWLLTSPMVKTRWANGKYDMIWLRQCWGIRCTNFTFDACLAGSLLDENRSCSLNLLTKVTVPDLGGYDDSFNAKYDKGHFEDIPPNEEYLTYAGGDTDATQQVSDKVKRDLLAQPKLARFYVNLLHPATRVFENIEHRGVLVDRQKYQVLKEDLEKEIKDLHKEAIELLPRRLRLKHLDKIEAQLKAGKNPLTPKIKGEYFFDDIGLGLKPKMFSEKTQQVSTAAAHFEMFEDVPEAKHMSKVLKKLSSAEKILSTYVVGFMKHLHVDDRFHPSYFLFHGSEGFGSKDGGTTTGRLSCKDPAFQCMVGSTLVQTDHGLDRLDWLVEHEGAGRKVLTHTGQWRDIVGVYKNGKQPIYRIETQSGKVIRCTGNHPILTPKGWVLAELIAPEDRVYAQRATPLHDPRIQPEEGQNPHVPHVGRDEESVRLSDVEGLHAVRGEGDNLLPEVGDLRGVSGGYGDEAGGYVFGPQGQQQGVYEGELPVGDTEAASIQSFDHEDDHAQRQDHDRGAVGRAGGHQSGASALSSQYRPVDDGSLIENQKADWRTFQEDVVVRVEKEPEELTYDLTIDRCHSFVANGLVVHNTIPKHHAWAKRLRDCFPAPPGYLMFEVDFSQGELRIAAVVAPDAAMVAAYKEGMDLHAITGSLAAGLTYNDVVGLKASSLESDRQKAKEIRQGGKAGNFGLLYGMQAQGFQNYARTVYGVTMSLQEATDFRNKFLYEQWTGLPAYHERIEKQVRMTKQVVSPLGRVRHLPDIDSWMTDVSSKAVRQAINSPIQATLSDLMLLALVEIENNFSADDVQVIGTVHDAAVGYVRQDKAVELMDSIAEVMENLPLHKFDWNPELTFPADWSLGETMGKMEEKEDYLKAMAA